MPAALALALLSGLTSLSYEILWAKALSPILGSTALAQSAVLCAFLGGLAAGNALLGARAESEPSPLRLFARLELLIALFGLAAPLALDLIDALPAGRLAAALASVALPAALMGGTLPALARASEGVPGLYAANCAGAVLGCLAAGFALIPGLGLDQAFRATAGLDLALAAAAWAAAAPARAPARRADEAGLRWLAAAAFASGVSSLAQEVSWMRLLSRVMGSSTYSFAVAVAAFITGLSLGGFLAGRLLARRKPLPLLAAAQLGCALFVLALLLFCERLPYAFLLLQNRFGPGAGSFASFEALKYLFCFALMGLPAAGLGMTLPLAHAAAGGGLGRLLAANALGNVLGAAASPWLFAPLGVEGVLAGAAGLNALVGAAAWGGGRGRPRARVAAALAAWAGLALVLPRWNPLSLSLGIFNQHFEKVPRSYAEFRALLEGGVEPLFHKEDSTGLVTVLRFPDGNLSLQVNGKTDASTGRDTRTQVLLAELPLLAAPGARRALVVGWGSGITAGAALRHPLARLDAVEISPAVVEGSRRFASANGGAQDDPRLRLEVDDAKSFLRSGTALYDVIISEPSNPWIAGMGDLFSADFYRRARERLAPDGVICQWAHLYQMDDETMRLLFRTFRAAFPGASLWTAQGGDMLLLASKSGRRPSLAALEAGFASPASRENLARAGISRFTTLLSLETLSPETLRRAAGEGPVSTDRWPRLEYRAPRALYAAEGTTLTSANDDRVDPARRRGLLLAAHLEARGRGLVPEEYMDFLIQPRSAREDAVVRAWIAQWSRSYPGDPRAARALRLWEAGLRANP